MDIGKALEQGFIDSLFIQKARHSGATPKKAPSAAKV